MEDKFSHHSAQGDVKAGGQNVLLPTWSCPANPFILASTNKVILLIANHLSYWFRIFTVMFFINEVVSSAIPLPFVLLFCSAEFYVATF